MAAKTKAKVKAKTEVLKTGYDPKNRPVLLIKSGKKFQVRKTLTNFYSKEFSKVSEAKKVFEQKIACSQNA